MDDQVPQTADVPREEKPVRLKVGDALSGLGEDLSIESTIDIGGDVAFEAARQVAGQAGQAVAEVKSAFASEATAGLIGHGLHILSVALAHIT